MKQNGLPDVFDKVYIQDRLESIESFIKDSRLNYKPSYQRDYVWPPFKGTYFIETILLHAEFTPVTVFEYGDIREVIDGRQRCETIDRFMKDQLILKSSGLDELWHLADKKWSQIGQDLRERIANAKIRVIIIKFTVEDEFTQAVELSVKREFFRRYNLGMTPLKKVEVYRAQYLRDEINLYFKKRFLQDEDFYRQVKDLFDHRGKNPEILMQTIRQLLVLQHIPINRFMQERDDIVNIYYDFLSFENPLNEQVRTIFTGFKEKIVLLAALKPQLNRLTKKSTGLVYECLYWAYSVMELAKVKLDKLNNEGFKDRLVKFLAANIGLFSLERSNQAPLVRRRYEKIAEFFSGQLRVDYGKYLKSETFVAAHKERMGKYMMERVRPGLEREHFSKSTPTSSTIKDIVAMMHKRKFEIRPPYQREEVINITKASALIESILKKLRLHPIYVYVRTDGVFEVIDGQQRLLAIIAFIMERYLAPSGELTSSKNNGFALRLRTGWMQELHGLTFKALPKELQQRIWDFKVDIIEIKQEQNPYFKPEELFKRLNYKPFPIKEHSFEFWNAYANADIINAVKSVYQKNKWLYLRKDNSRMMNEELLMHLIYFEYATESLPLDLDGVKEVLNMHMRGEKVAVQVKNKASITRILENDLRQQDFLNACKEFETKLLSKFKTLVCLRESKNSDKSMSRQLDNFLHTKSIRTAMNFWLLWISLRGISIPTLYYHRDEVRKEMDRIYEVLHDAVSIEEFEKTITEAWLRLAKNKIVPMPPKGQKNTA